MKIFNTILITLIIVFLAAFIVAEVFDISIQAGKNKENNTEQDTLQNTIAEGEKENIPQELPEITELTAQILSEGTGERQVKAGDQITVHYTGILLDGTKFDSSVDRGEAFQITIGVGQVIPGWDQGVIGMKVGEVRRLNVPSEFAYGEQGIPDAIPPNSPLIFDIQLMSIDNEEIVQENPEPDVKGETTEEDIEEPFDNAQGLQEESDNENEATSSGNGVSTGLTAGE